MDRTSIIESLKNSDVIYDIVVIGGGATGLGTALDAASRGYNTLLLEQHDFAKGTSSRSTKLVHGGVRYLKQGNISLVRDALKERGLLLQNAPHLVKNQSFIVPGYSWWEKPFYGIGMKIYDLLAGKQGFGKSRLLSTEDTIRHLPTLDPGKLKGGVLYYDGQFDDSRLAVNLMQSIYDHGGTALNYTKVTGFLKDDQKVVGVKASDQETGEQFTVRSKSVVNATGVFTDEIRHLLNPEKPSIIQFSQGVHIVLDREFQPGDSALMIPKTADGRVLFAVPWHNKVIIGTTDTPVESAELEPKAQRDEIDFLISHSAKYLTKDPEYKDVQSYFTGLRPLVKPEDDTSTKTISRDHTILVDSSGLVTVTGGKWTTYRKMAEETVDMVVENSGLDINECTTENLKIHGWTDQSDPDDPYHLYGSDAASVRKIEDEDEEFKKPLHPDLPYRSAEVIWSVRNEMARTVEDLLSRRTRALLLNARATIEIAESVASLMAKELGYDQSWIDSQVKSYHQLAEGYILNE